MDTEKNTIKIIEKILTSNLKQKNYKGHLIQIKWYMFYSIIFKLIYFQCFQNLIHDNFLMLFIKKPKLWVVN